MRFLILILLFGISESLLGQEISRVEVTKTNKYSEDSELRVIYKDSLLNQHNGRSPAYFVNGIHIKNETAIIILNPNKIESVDIEKESFKVDGKEYYGKIIIKTKESYKPNFMTLKELVNKYLPTEINPIIFQIDDTIVDYNEKEYLADENYILKIELTKIKMTKLSSHVNFIKLITKTPESIEKANQIMIRGDEIKPVANSVYKK